MNLLNISTASGIFKTAVLVSATFIPTLNAATAEQLASWVQKNQEPTVYIYGTKKINAELSSSPTNVFEAKSAQATIESKLVNSLAELGYKIANTEREFENDDVFGEKLLLTYLVTTSDGKKPDVGELFDANMRLIGEHNLFDAHNIVLTVLPA